ncbi:MAG: spore cortex biosynthesis protein YabQ [Clostridia bacterium]|nr:spore cortex biosynthesis protein YabQ [Clostridia bacterium]
MDTKNQFAFFLLSIGIGFVGGLLYELFAFFRTLFGCDRGKRRALGVGLDITFCVCFAAMCIYLSFYLHFPDFRGYMCLGWVFGGIIYSKTLRRILAFSEKVCYNVLVRMVTKAKSKEKTLKKERKDI